MDDEKASSFKRLMSMVIALPLYFFCCTTDSLNNLPVLFASSVVTLACLYEYYAITTVNDTRKPFMFVGMFTAFCINIVMYIYAFGINYGWLPFGGRFDVRVVLFLLVICIGLIGAFQILFRPLKNGIYSLSTTVFGVVLVVVFYSHIILLKSLGDGVFYIILFHGAVMSNDTFGYIGGIIFGKHKTNFTVSPNKSWEGYFSGLLMSVVSLNIAHWVFKTFYGKDLFGYFELVLLGIVLALLGNMGDLIESAIKRDGSQKDSGSIIPGHGGMWDVFDALIFCMPFFYYYLIIKGVS